MRRAGGAQADEGYSAPICFFHDALGIEKKGAGGFQSNGSQAGFVGVENGATSDGWYVKSHVLNGLGDLDEGAAVSADKLAGTLNTSVGTFDGFESDDGAGMNNDTLANI